MAGYGENVTVTEDHLVLNGTGGLVMNRFNETMAFAAIWNQRALDSIDRADELLENFTLAPGWNDVLTNVVINPVSGVNLPERPSFGTVTLSDDWPTDFPLFPLLKGAGEIDTTYTKPIAPADINPTLQYTEAGYSSEMFLKIFTEVYNSLENGGIGISAELESAIFDADQIRNNRINSTKYDSDMRASGATGYRFPSGVVAAILMEAQEKSSLQDRETSANILKMRLDLAVRNKEFSIEKGLDYEKVLRDFHNNKENRTLEAQTAAVQLVAQIYTAKLDKFKSEWEGVKSDLLAKVSVADIRLKESQQLLDGFAAQSDGVKTKTDIIASQNNSKIEGFKGEVQAYSAETEGLAAYYKAITEHDKLYIQKAELELTKAVEELKAMLAAKVSYDGFSKETISIVGKLAQEAVASALNAVNATASLTSGETEGRTENWSHRDGITETYSHNDSTT